ncbi:hypothetical protein OG292_23770 [Streptomyces sp. NBC_01511]|uniref:hypothetical protein n=1 Tax=unclassified Streptomyces TaxID=2593676 RepID=UPI003868C3F6
MSDDPEGLARIAALLELVADEKSPLPDIKATRRRLAHGLDLTSRLTTGSVTLATPRTELYSAVFFL